MRLALNPANKERMRLLKKLVNEAWQTRRTFQSQTPKSRHAETAKRLNIFRVRRDAKMVLVAENAGYGTIRIVAFPKMNDWRTFERAEKILEDKGPASLNRGGIGTIELVKRSKYLMLSYSQNQFITGHGEEAGKHTVPRGKAAQYLGWRYRALREAVLIANEKGVPLYIPERECVKPNFVEDLDKACLEIGLHEVKKPRPAYADGRKTVVFVGDDPSRRYFS
ncbi:MAG: hypothetical protein V1676_00275 [Candidatus Diapherotrites archaeon]